MYRYILGVCLVLAGCASTKQPEISGPIHVTCEGKTFEQAKMACFSQAIEFAVGAVVVSSTEVRNSTLAKNDILQHSSGYVDDYSIKNRIDGLNRVVLSMDVKVKQSKIAERIIGVQTPTGEIQGQRLGAQYSTFMRNKATGDQLLRQVLNDYPKYGLVVEKGEIAYQVDINRNPVIVIPYTIKWNYQYLVALNEALTLTQDEKSRTIFQESVSISAKNPKNWILGRTDTYYFNDVGRARMIKQAFVDRIYLNVKFKDNAGRVLIAGCDDGRYFSGPNITDPFWIDGNEIVEQDLNITIRVNKHKIEQISEAELSLSTTQCKFIE